MGYIRKADMAHLAEVLQYRTVEDRRTAEEVADAFMRLSYNRNLLLEPYRLKLYVAACVYMLAHKFAVPIAHYMAQGSVPVRYRGRMGDMVHLIVLLSYPPATVVSFLKADAKVPELFADVIDDFQEGPLQPLAANMNRIILEEGLLSFRADIYSLRVPQWAVTPYSKAVNYSSYDLSGLSSKALLLRSTCDIRASLEERRRDNALTLPVLGARFRNLRGVAGLTQKQFADKLGISKSACLRLEAGGQISVDVLFRCLLYYSRIINLDVLFDRRIWELAQIDRDLLYKKVHIMSVIHRKHQLLRDELLALVKRAEHAVHGQQPTATDVPDALAELRKQLETGFNSILSLTEE